MTTEGTGISYEEKREANIRKNKEMLAELQLVSADAPYPSRSTRAALGVPKENRDEERGKRKRKRTMVPASLPPTTNRVTRSRRRLDRSEIDRTLIRRQKDGSDDDDNDNKAHTTGGTPSGDGLIEGKDDPDANVLLDPEDFFPQHILSKAVHVTGHFHGWISAELRARWGIEASAEQAWEAEGGGKFSFKNPMGD
ncbi:hypothetical protein BJ684DRAFT_17832, partial [Piptocephalis cylindrospora]